MIKIVGFFLRIVEYVSPKRAYKFTYALFHKPFPPKWRPSDLEFLDSGKERMVETDHGPIYYHEWGEGKTVLLVHGWSGKSSQFKRLFKLLEDLPYRIVIPQMPGHGKSKAKLSSLGHFVYALSELQKHLGELEAMVGHSIGGSACIIVAANGVKINKIATINSLANNRDILENFTKLLGLKGKSVDFIDKLISKNYGGYIDDFSARNGIRELRHCDFLCIHDVDDPFISFSNLNTFKEENEQIDTMVTNSLGHNMALKDAAVLDKINEFIRK
jgi:esterase/lipase